jgi:hypothetical protein
MTRYDKPRGRILRNRDNSASRHLVNPKTQQWRQMKSSCIREVGRVVSLDCAGTACAHKKPRFTRQAQTFIQADNSSVHRCNIKQGGAVVQPSVSGVLCSARVSDCRNVLSSSVCLSPVYNTTHKQAQRSGSQHRTEQLAQECSPDDGKAAATKPASNTHAHPTGGPAGFARAFGTPDGASLPNN